jgi:hypothetical protein
MLAAGDLTQLEWVDLCANELNLDGVEFAVAHFPRLDPDYIAQLKKLCADRCLTVAALHFDTPVNHQIASEQVAALRAALDIALGLGAPLVRLALGPSSGSPAAQWRELIRMLKEVCVAAKALNITLALRPQGGSPVASPLDAKRVLKECDSAWLRLAPDARVFGAPSREQWDESLASSVLAIAPMALLDTFGADESIDYISALAYLWEHQYRGFLSLEYSGAEAERPAMARAVPWLRGMVAKEALKSTAAP